MKTTWKKILRFILRNNLLLLFALAVLLVAGVAAKRLFFDRQTYVYARVKVGQGLWWASTLKPNLWFVRALQEAQSEKDYSGNTEAEIQRIIYYQYSGSSTYDVYLDMKLEVSKLDKAGKYSFKRSTIGVAAPVDFEFNNIQFSGTIIKLSERPLPREQYTVKTVTLTKRNAFPWEYDAIRVGDIAHNGEVGVLEVLGKDSIDTATITQDAYGNLVPAANTPGKYITVVMKMKGKMVNDTFVFGEEQVIAPGKDLSLGTRNFIFSNFVVTKVE